MFEKWEHQQDPAHPDDETLPRNLRESLPLSFLRNGHIQGELELDLINPLGQCVIDQSFTWRRWKGVDVDILKMEIVRHPSVVFLNAKLILEVEF